MKNDNLTFYPMVTRLETILNSTSDMLKLIRVIDEKEFLTIRQQMVDVFNTGDTNDFTGEFGDEVEFGDISDAIRTTTFSLYPQSTEMEKHINLQERKIWCNKILSNMDEAAKGF